MRRAAAQGEREDGPAVVFFDINGWELLIIFVVAVVVIGPERLPEYIGHLRRWIREAKKVAEGAKEQLREQMGPEFDDIDWKAYDPRQYDPRRIVREALAEEWHRHDGDPDDAAGSAGPRPVAFDPAKATPFDVEAT